MRAETGSARVSIVIALYRARDRVPAILDRLAALHNRDFDVVLVDDGSGDGTSEALAAAIGDDPRFTVIALPTNGGVGAARGVGFSAATGEFIWNIDSDDDWPADALDTLLAASDGVDVVIGSAERQSAAGTTRAMPAPVLEGPRDVRTALSMLLSGTVTGHLWNKLLRRSILDSSVYTTSRLHSDLIMVARILERSASFATVPGSVYTYIETPGSNIHSRRPRGESLDEVETAVRGAVAAAAPGLVDSRGYRRFFAKSVVLSRLRDAVRADYPPEERARRFSAARREVSVAGIFSLMLTGDLRSAVLLVLAKFAPPVFRRVMRR